MSKPTFYPEDFEELLHDVDKELINNMFHAVPIVMSAFNLGPKEAQEALRYYMYTNS